MKKLVSNVWQPCGVILLSFLLFLPESGVAQEARIANSSVAISSRAGGRAELELELVDGTDHIISFRDGTIRVNGRAVGTYEPGGTLESSWRELLSRYATREPSGLGSVLLNWEPKGLSGVESRAAATLERQLHGLLESAPAELPVTQAESVTVTSSDGTQLSIAPGSLSFETLTEQLSGLHSSLRELGEAAAGAEDQLALIVHDDYTIPAGRTVAGNLALLGGTLHLGGTVEGDVLVLHGTLVLESSAKVAGDVLQVGGELTQEGGQIAGELLSIRSLAVEAVPAPAPEVRVRAVDVRTNARHQRARPGFLSRPLRNLGHAAGGLIGTAGLLLVFGLLGLVTVYFGQSKLEAVADTVRRSLGRSFAVGLAGEVLLCPVLLILLVLVITIPVIPFLLIGVGLAMVGGYLASAHAVGEIFAARRYRYEWIERLRRSNAYYYVLSGLVLLMLPFAARAALWVLGGPGGFLRVLAATVACILTWMAVTTGFGAVLLTRGGTRSRVGPEWTAGETAWSEANAEDSEPEEPATDE